MTTVHGGQRSGVAAGGEGTAHRCGQLRLVSAEDALDGSKSSLVLDVVVDCGTWGAHAVGAASTCGSALGAARRTPVRTRARAAVPRGGGGAPLHAPSRPSQMRVVLALSAAASSLAPLSPILLSATRGAHAAWARRARAAIRSGRRAARPPARARACGGAAVGGRGVVARTVEAQPGEGLVGFERGGQLLGPLAPILLTAARGGARAVGAASTCGSALGRRAARPSARVRVRRCRGVGGAPLHAPPRSSVVRVVLALSAAASSLAPSSPIVLPAARGAHAPWARRARAANARGGAPHAPLHACARAAVPRGGEGRRCTHC